jgi:hypothetical protein
MVYIDARMWTSDHRAKGLPLTGLRKQSRLKRLLVGATVALMAIGTSACETTRTSSDMSVGASSGVGTSVGASTGQGTPLAEHDGDGDIDRQTRSPADTDNDAIPEYAPPADPADRKAIVELISRYYAVAARGDGARACSMLDATFAELLVEEHRGRGPRALRGDTCAHILSKLFEQRHRDLAEDIAGGYRVLVVQARGNRGYALVRFPSRNELRELELIVRRTHGVWKMDVVLDNGAQ